VAAAAAVVVRAVAGAVVVVSLAREELLPGLVAVGQEGLPWQQRWEVHGVNCRVSYVPKFWAKRATEVRYTSAVSTDLITETLNAGITARQSGLMHRALSGAISWSRSEVVLADGCDTTLRWQLTGQIGTIVIAVRDQGSHRELALSTHGDSPPPLIHSAISQGLERLRAADVALTRTEAPFAWLASTSTEQREKRSLVGRAAMSITGLAGMERIIDKALSDVTTMAADGRTECAINLRESDLGGFTSLDTMLPTIIDHVQGAGHTILDVVRVSPGHATLRVQPANAVQEFGTTSRLDELSKLADLHDRGVLSEAEFSAEKQRLLDS
jgi:hypothetical protein